MGTTDLTKNQKLHEFLLEKIKRKGPIAFADFMDAALYHRDWGYYNSSKQKIGKEGDFYTSAHVSSIFGRTIAKQLIEVADYLGWKDLIFLEFGGGEGYLAKDILEAIKALRPIEFEELNYYLCERSINHQEIQKEQLKDFVSQVKWVNDLPEIREGEQFKGIVFSNELIDAFPVHRIKMIDGQLREIFVSYRDGFIEKPGELSNPLLKEYLSFLNFQLVEGQEIEINLEAISWLEKLSGYLKEGFVITIDYGYLLPELIAPHRFDGTIMCYHKHRADDKPLEDVGLKDITSHVNFTALMEYGRSYNLQVAGYTNQMKFLVGLQIGDWLVEPGLTEHDRQKIAFALKELLMPEKMGERFKVLIQYKGLKENPLLSGLKGFN